MTELDRAEFSKIIYGLGEVYGEALSKPRIDAYFASLIDLTIEQFDAAATQLMRSSKFFPRPAEILDAARGNIEDQAHRAWATFLDAAADSGYASVRFYDSAAAYAVDAVFGGWIKSGELLAAGWVDSDGRHQGGCSDEMLAHYRNHFIKQYLAFRRMPREVDLYRPGRNELSMRSNSALAGLMPILHQPVKLIGNGKVLTMRLPFDTRQGMLLPECQDALNQGPEKARQFALQPPKPAPVAMLEDSSPITPEEIEEVKRKIKLLSAGSTRKGEAA